MIKRLLLPLCALAAALGYHLLSPSLSEPLAQHELFKQGFEKRASWPMVTLQQDADTTFARAFYHPTAQGSQRLVKRIPLTNKVTRATLSFRVRFAPEFEWVKGGKLHGLGSAARASGCRDIIANAWSNRVIWRQDGEPQLYIYHQGRQTECGERFSLLPGRTTRFKRGQWHRVRLSMTLNSSAQHADGKASLDIDGERVIEANNLKFYAAEDAHIAHFLFSTFYGGNTPAWAPSTTQHVDFDDFVVTRE